MNEKSKKKRKHSETEANLNTKASVPSRLWSVCLLDFSYYSHYENIST